MRFNYTYSEISLILRISSIYQRNFIKFLYVHQVKSVVDSPVFTEVWKMVSVPLVKSHVALIGLFPVSKGGFGKSVSEAFSKAIRFGAVPIFFLIFFLWKKIAFFLAWPVFAFWVAPLDGPLHKVTGRNPRSETPSIFILFVRVLKN